MVNMSAYHALWKLHQRNLATTPQLPSEVETVVESWEGIGFSLLGFYFAVPVNELSEMLEIPSYTKLPGVQSWVSGVSNVRGRLLPLVDLAAFFSGELTENKKHHRLLVVDTQHMYIGLWVDQVFGIQYFPVDAHREKKTGVFPVLLENFVGGYFLQKNRDWNMFRLQKLIEDPRFLDVAKS